MKNVFIILTIGLALTACQQSDLSNTKTDSELGSVQAVSTTAMKFEHRLSVERAQVGVPFEIEIDFTGASNSKLDAEFSTSPGLQMTGNAARSFQMNKTGQADTHTITIVPQSEGIHYVNVHQSGTNQKPSVIRVIAGDKDIKEYLQTPGEIVEQEDGTKVITMKADEG